MTQYIDKSAVVAEIERRIDFFSDVKNEQQVKNSLDCAIAFAGMIDFLDTLEVKEVGLDLGSSDGDVGVKTVWDGEHRKDNSTKD